MKVRIRMSPEESAAEPVRVNAPPILRHVTGPRKAMKGGDMGWMSVTGLAGSKLRLQLPDGERGPAAQPESGSHLAEVALQSQPIPLRAAQMHVGIGSRGVAVPLPIAPGKGAEVQHSAAEPPEVAQGTRGRRGVEILQHVVADHEIEGRGAAVILDPAVLPAVAAAEIRARLQTDVLRLGQEALERRAQQA